MLELKNVSKFYYGKGMVSAGFSKVSLKFDMGEFVAITGESGSGKSTLLNVISGLDSYEEGEMYINGEETSHYTEKDYELYRKKYVANIFQSFNLVNSYTVYQNIELILLLRGEKKKNIKSKIMDLIKAVDLYKYRNKKVSRLSGGQKQRVAIARALAIDSPIIVADEPTGNLDKKSATSVLKLLHDLSKNKLVIIVTHNYDQIEEYVTRKITMHDGKVLEDKKIKNHDEIVAKETNFKDTTFINKFRIGFRNSFNIIPKFLLISSVFFFVIISLFATLSLYNELESEYEFFSNNIYFRTDSENRIVIKKNDKTAFTEEDYNKILALDNVDSIVKNDVLLEANASVYNDEAYFYGHLDGVSKIDSVDIGRMPENDKEVVVTFNRDKLEDEYYAKMISNEEKFFGAKYSLEIYLNYSTTKSVKIVGLKYVDNEEEYYETIYVKDSSMKDFETLINKGYTRLYYTINGRENIDYDTIIASSKVKKGKCIIPEDYNYQCKKFNCKGTTIKLRTQNINFNDTLKLTVSKTYNKDNIKKLTGFKYNDYPNNIFISMYDYDRLFNNGYYQSSVFVSDISKLHDTVNELKKLDLNTLCVKDTMKQEVEDDIRILNIVKVCLMIGLLVVLFYISYFIIKLILKSRNVYYSTLRLIGATYKCTKELLKIELITLANVSYIIFITLIILIKNKIIFSQELLDYLNEFSNNWCYIASYLIVIIMSLLISNRFARKLFKNTVMNTYKEEV